MASYKEYFGNSAVLVEIDMDAVEAGGKGGNLAASFRTITEVALACSEAVGQLPEEKKPSEIEVTFGLKALSSGKLAVTVNEPNANFKVRLKWGGGTGVEGIMSDSKKMMPS